MLPGAAATTRGTPDISSVTTTTPVLAQRQGRRRRRLDEYAPHREAALKLFALKVLDIDARRLPPREAAFELDGFVNSDAENAQTFINCVYAQVDAASNPRVHAAAQALHAVILPGLFRAIKLRGVLPSDDTIGAAPPSHIRTTGRAETGVKGTVELDNDARPLLPDAEVAHRLVCVLLRPQSTWLGGGGGGGAVTAAGSAAAAAAALVDNATNVADSSVSQLRMKLLLEYARCASASFATPAHGQMLANAFGAIIGSLQGTDPHSPEVAVVVASLGLLCDRLTQILSSTSGSSGSSGSSGGLAAAAAGSVRLPSVETGLSVLIIALELVPSTALDPLWEMISAMVASASHHALRGRLLEVLSLEIGRMQAASRRSVLVRRMIESGYRHARARL
jgi:hypothetical protein